MTGVAAVSAGQVVAAIRASAYTHINEKEWQAALAEALQGSGLPAEREVPLPGAGAIDLMSGRIGIEVKVAGTAAQVERQLRRYAHSERVDELVLVTNRVRHRNVPAILEGKPVTVLVITGAFR